MTDEVLNSKAVMDGVYLSSFVSTKTRDAEASVKSLKRLGVDETKRSVVR